jgi:hypothetical protein
VPRGVHLIGVLLWLKRSPKATLAEKKPEGDR